MIFQIFTAKEKHIHHQYLSIIFLQQNSLNFDKTITMKHLLHIYYFTNVNYTGKVDTSRNSLLSFREELQFKNFEF